MALDSTILVGLKLMSFASTKGISKFGSQLEKQSKKADKLRRNALDFSEATLGSFQRIGAGLAIAGGAVALGLGVAINEAAKLENQMFKLQAVISPSATGLNGLTDEIKDLREQFRSLAGELPISSTQLAKSAIQARKLGVDKDALVSLAEVSVKLDTISDLTAEMATKNIVILNKQFRLMSGTAKDTAKEFENTANMVAFLSKNSAAQESQLLDIAIRFGNVSDALKMSRKETLLLAVAAKEAGIRDEKAGTGFSVIVREIGKNLTEFAKLLNVSNEEFQEMFSRDSLGTIRKVATEFSNVDGDLGKLAENMQLMNLRSNGALTALLGVSKAGGQLDSLLDSLNKGTEDYVDNLFAIESQSATNVMKMLKGTMSDMSAVIGEELLGVFKLFLQTLNFFFRMIVDLPGPVKTFIAVFGVISSTLLIISGAALILGSALGFLVIGFWRMEKGLIRSAEQAKVYFRDLNLVIKASGKAVPVSNRLASAISRVSSAFLHGRKRSSSFGGGLTEARKAMRKLISQDFPALDKGFKSVNKGFKSISNIDGSGIGGFTKTLGKDIGKLWALAAGFVGSIPAMLSSAGAAGSGALATIGAALAPFLIIGLKIAAIGFLIFVAFKALKPFLIEVGNAIISAFKPLFTMFTEFSEMVNPGSTGSAGGAFKAFIKMVRLGLLPAILLLKAIVFWFKSFGNMVKAVVFIVKAFLRPVAKAIKFMKDKFSEFGSEVELIFTNIGKAADFYFAKIAKAFGEGGDLNFITKWAEQTASFVGIILGLVFRAVGAIVSVFTLLAKIINESIGSLSKELGIVKDIIEIKRGAREEDEKRLTSASFSGTSFLGMGSKGQLSESGQAALKNQQNRETTKQIRSRFEQEIAGLKGNLIGLGDLLFDQQEVNEGIIGRVQGENKIMRVQRENKKRFEILSKGGIQREKFLKLEIDTLKKKKKLLADEAAHSKLDAFGLEKQGVVKNAAKGFINDIFGVFGAKPFETDNNAKLFHRKGLATGGIATKPILSPIAEAGPEAVIPLNKLDKMLAGSGSGSAPVSITIPVTVTLDGHIMGETIVKVSEEVIRREFGDRSSRMSGIG